MKYLLLIACFWGISTQLLTAQDTISVERSSIETSPLTSKYYPKSRIIGLNMTPLLTQLIPFNRADPRDFGPFLMRFKNYKNGKNAIRFGLGVQILGEDIFFSTEESKTFLNIQWGWERRKNISDRWSYTKGIEAVALIGNSNLPNERNSESVSVGVGLPWGIEYAIAPRITLSTEIELVLLVSEFGPTIRLLPPVGLFLNYYFTK
jgi:hypothetical protein